MIKTVYRILSNFPCPMFSIFMPWPSDNVGNCVMFSGFRSTAFDCSSVSSFVHPDIFPRCLGLQEYHGITITANTVILGVCRDFWPSPWSRVTAVINGRPCTKSAWWLCVETHSVPFLDTHGRHTTHFVQLVLSFLQAIRLFDPQQAKTLTSSSFSAIIPVTNYRDLHKATAPYKQAVTEVDSDVKLLAFFCFSNKECFSYLCLSAVCTL